MALSPLGVYQGEMTGSAANEDFFSYGPQIDMAPTMSSLVCGQEFCSAASHIMDSNRCSGSSNDG
jgi:hypothetical protein